MYSVPARAKPMAPPRRILGNWFASRPGARAKVVLATKVAGPSRNMDWVRNGSANLTRAEILQACDDSLKRLRTDVIDLYQIHWPNRNVPAFGAMYFDPKQDREYSSIQEQLDGMAALVKAGKVRHIGLSNESPYGLCEFVRLAEQHGLPRPITVQNPYALTNRSLDNGLDEAMYRLGVSLHLVLAAGLRRADGQVRRGRSERRRTAGPVGALRRHEEATLGSAGSPGRGAPLQRAGAAPWPHAHAHGAGLLYTSWRVASTIIGVTSIAQLDENLAAWGTTLSPELLAEIDAIRWTLRDPAQ